MSCVRLERWIRGYTGRIQMCQLIFSFHFCCFRILPWGIQEWTNRVPTVWFQPLGWNCPVPKAPHILPQPTSEPHTNHGASPCHLPPHFLYPSQRTALHPNCDPAATHTCVPPTEPTGGAPILPIPHPPSPPPRTVISAEQARGGGGTLFTFLGFGWSGGFGAAGHFGALGRRLRFRFCSSAWGEGGAGGGRKAGMMGEGGTGRVRDGARSNGGPMYRSSRSCHPTALGGRISVGDAAGGDADTIG